MYLLVHDLLVKVKGEVVVFSTYLFRVNEKLLRGAVILFFQQFIGMGEFFNDVGNVVFLVLVGAHGGQFGFVLIGFTQHVAFVVQRVAVGFHVVKPHLVCPAGAGFGKDKDPGGYPGIGFKHARGHGDHRLQLVFFHQFFPDGQVALGGAKQHACRHDHRATPARPQHAQHKGQEEQFCFRAFSGFAQVKHFFQAQLYVVIIHCPRERRVGEDQGELVFQDIVTRQGIHVLQLGVVNAVHLQVHGTHADHGGVVFKPA